MVTGHNHFIEEDTFKITNVDWEAGKLDFTITFTDRQTDAALRFKKHGGSLYLESFKAIGIARGVFSDGISAVEYRIPEYSYVLNVPIEMRGLKSQDEKTRDDFEKSLSTSDRVIIQQHYGKMMTDDKVGLKQIIPDIDRIENGQRPVTAGEAEKMINFMFSGFLGWLPASGMSADGQVKTRTFVTGIKTQMLQSMLKDLDRK